MGFLIGYYQTKKGTSWKIPYIDIYKVKVNETPSMLMSLLLFGLAGKTIIILSGNYYHVGVTSFVPSFPYSTLGGFSSFLPYFSLMSLFSGLVAYNLYRRSGLQFWLVVSILIFIFEVVFELPSGSKEKVIKPLVFLGIYFSIQNSLPLKTGLITFFFAVFFVFPFINLYRSGQNLSFTETADTFLADKADGFAYDDEDNFALARRLNGVGVVASVIDQTPEKFGYRYGTDYLALSYVFIPRFIWTGKPAVMDHNGFARQYGLIAPTDFRTSVSPYWQGEAYMNFGWFGVIVAFLLGVFMKKVYLWFFRFGPPTLMLSLMYIGVLYILSRQSQLPMTLLGMLQVVLVTSFLLLPFVSRRSLKNRPHQNKVTEGHHSAVSK
ncbi:MAG: hypothetical protein RIE86_23505 [Imperialibacter sp.]|uniref:hypothetical protein n=1 Tax=Imperialibacter sp. TaxID=2038411 RepID=UPI0032EF3FAA